MTAVCDSTMRMSLGAYVLGALDPRERADMDAHLSGCEACREELAGLAAMPGLLGRVRLEDVVDAPPSPSHAKLDRLLGRVRAARRRRRRRLVVAGATAAVLAAAITGALLTQIDGGRPADQVTAVTAANPRTGVTARLELRPVAWGTEIRVRMRGVPPGTRCRMVAVARDGTREVAGHWRASYEGAADVRAATAISRDQLRAISVVTAAGRPLVRAPVAD